MTTYYNWVLYTADVNWFYYCISYQITIKIIHKTHFIVFLLILLFHSQNKCDVLQQNQAQVPNIQNWVIGTSLIHSEFPSM